MKLTFMTIAFLLSSTLLAGEVQQCQKRLQLENYPKKYIDLVCNANKEMNKRRFTEASQLYEEATKIDIFEFPNFEIYPKLAYAYCGIGKLKIGLKTLSDAACMIKIYSGVLQCYSPIGSDQRNHNKFISDHCFNIMCGELFLPYYSNHDENLLKKIKSMKKEISKVENFCEKQNKSDIR